ncbi:hypothetical protein CF326_g3343 [Tilletia indica]|nr:hypothetical protein CF326_g3343 [Tilletia indica]
MPRSNPFPSRFDRLPGEIVLNILRFLLEPRPRSETLRALIVSLLPWHYMNWTFKLATDRIIGLHLHTFHQLTHEGIHHHTAPWHVSTRDPVMMHQDYWMYFQGRSALKVPNFRHVLNALTTQRLPVLRCISLDLRPHEPLTNTSLCNWKTLHAPRWVHVATILTRLLMASKGLQELNLRVPAQQDLIDLVEELVANNANLRVLRIDVDSTVGTGRHIRPRVHLHKMFPPSQSRACLQTFCLRAPSCDIHCSLPPDQAVVRFADLLQRTKELVFASSSFDAGMPPLLWIARVLQHMPVLELCDLAIDAKYQHATPISPCDIRPIPLPRLSKLSLQLPELDGTFLRALQAPSLHRIRLHSMVPIESWTHCDDNHFPNLFIATVSCYGPSATRIRALGVEAHRFAHSLSRFDNWTNPHDLPFIVYIRPLDQEREGTPPPSEDSESSSSI